ncbi:MAG: DUF86 domain-containing protein [Alloprevotella sp.]
MREASRDKMRLEHIAQAIDRINRFTFQKRFEDLVENDMMYYAVVKNIEIIGEAANLLTDKFKTEHPQTPWKLISGMRNYIVHEYFQVDNTVIWDVLQNDLPLLYSQVNNYLKDF